MQFYGLVRRAALVAFIAMTGSVLVACGGGGGGGTAPQETGSGTSTGKAPGVTYSAFILDEVISAPVLFDIDGAIELDSFTYTLSSNATNCSFNSTPNDPTTPICSPLADGDVVLLCENTTGEFFDTALFKSSAVPATLDELVGLTLQGVSCGAPSVRNVSASFTIDSATSVTQVLGGSSFLWSGSYLAQILSAAGVQYFDWQFRYVLQKVVRGNKTTYVLLELYNKAYPGANGVRAPRIYVLERTG